MREQPRGTSWLAGGGVSRFGILPARDRGAAGQPGVDGLALPALPGGGGATPAAGARGELPQTHAAGPVSNPARSRNRVLARLHTALLALNVPKPNAGRERSPQRVGFAHESPPLLSAPAPPRG